MSESPRQPAPEEIAAAYAAVHASGQVASAAAAVAATADRAHKDARGRFDRLVRLLLRVPGKAAVLEMDGALAAHHLLVRLVPPAERPTDAGPLMVDELAVTAELIKKNPT